MTTSKNKNLIIIIEGPGGVGKDSILNGLIEQHPKLYERFITTTTRPMRENESEGHPYNFVTEKEFKERIQNGDIFESTYRHQTYRGMSRRFIDKVLNSGKTAVGSIDIKGMEPLKKNYPNNTKFVFIKAPLNDLEARLKRRGDSDQERQSRIAEYNSYMENEHKYDATIENKDLTKAIKDLHKLIASFKKNM